MLDMIIVVIILAVLFLGSFFVLKKTLPNYLANLTRQTTEASLRVIEEKSKELFKEERERLNEKVDDRISQGEKSLDAKKDLIKEVVDNMRKEINDSQNRLIKSDKERIIEFQNLKTTIDSHKNVTESLQLTTDNLRKILSNNQLRGSFGQEVAEDLLKMAGFVKGQNYTSQGQQETTGNKPDFTVLLPDKTKINIDVKFPFQALQRLQETEDKEQQKQYLAEFKADIKTKIKEVTTRNYISLEENTVDFVVMFIPNEMIFSFIYEKFPDVWKDGLKNKVVMCGPFSFTAILRMVQQSYDNFKYQKDLYKIITQIKLFETEYEKFTKSFDSLGKKISAVSDEYEEVTTTRNKKLTTAMDKIRSQEMLID